MVNKFKNNYLQNFFYIYICAIFYIICYSFHYNKFYYQILTFIIFIKICLVSIYFLKKKIENKEFTKIYYLLILFIIFSISVFANDPFNNSQTIISFFYLYSLIAFYLLSLGLQGNFFRVFFVSFRFLFFILTLVLLLFVIYKNYALVEKNSLIDPNYQVYFIKEFYYNKVFHTNFFNLLIIFVIIFYLKFYKILFLHKINLFFFLIVIFHSFFSVSIAVNIILLGAFLYLGLMYFKIKAKYINFILLFLTLVFLLLTTIYTEIFVDFINNFSKNLYIQDFINQGEISSINTRLDRIENFKNDLKDSGINKILFGSLKIQLSNFYHNSFFSITSYFGLLIMLFVLFTLFLKTTRNIIIPLSFIFYFYTTDNLLMHNYIISSLFWLTYSLINIEKSKVTSLMIK